MRAGRATAWNLYENIERLKLAVDRIVPLHGPGAVPIAELATAVGAER